MHISRHALIPLVRAEMKYQFVSIRTRELEFPHASMTFDIFTDAELAMRVHVDAQLIPSCLFERLELPAVRPDPGTSYCSVGAMPRTCNVQQTPFLECFRFGESDSLQRVDAIDFPEVPYLLVSDPMHEKAWFLHS